MGNMTIENIGRLMSTGNMEVISEHGRYGSYQNNSIANAEIKPEAGSASGESTDFLNVLNKKVEQINEMQVQADRAVKELTAGRNKNIHETMLMLEKADLSFKLMMQVRNKMIDAYREVMRMQV